MSIQGAAALSYSGLLNEYGELKDPEYAKCIILAYRKRR